MGDAAGVQKDYSLALELNPIEVSIRMDYANALMRLNLPVDAIEQYELA